MSRIDATPAKAKTVDRAGRIYAAAALAAVVQRLLIGFWPCDDAFIVWRFAYHLVHSGQLAFNPGDPVFGCTTLSYALALAALHALGLPLAAASAGLTLAGDLACCLLLVRLSRELTDDRRAGLAAVALWLTQPIVALNGVGGMETSLFCALLLTFVLACRAGRFGEALALLALLGFTRIDGVVVAPIWIYAWQRAGRPRPRAAAVAVALALAAGYLWLTLAAYGSLLPQSAAAKAAACPRTLAGPLVLAVSYAASMAGLLSTWHWFLTPHALLAPGLLIAVARLRRTGDAERMLTLTALAHAGFFVASGRPCVMFFQWYYAPFLTLILLPAMAETQRLAGRFAQRLQGRAPAGAAIAWFAVTVGALAVAHWMPQGVLARLIPPLIAGNPERLARFVLAIRVDVAVAVGLGWWALAYVPLTRGAAAAPDSSHEAGAGDGGLARPTGVALAAVALTLVPLVFDCRQAATRYERREGSYLALGRWAARQAAPGDWIGAQEIGAIGWETRDHPLYDELGLITRGALRITRAEWAARLRPAMIVGSSSLDVPRAANFPTLPGYRTIRVGHNVLWLREDLTVAWDAAPPAIK